MLFKLFVYSNNTLHSQKIFDNILCNIEKFIIYREYKKIEPYWKMENVYVIEANVKFSKNFDEEENQRFLNSISDKWITFGNPIQEVLASETAEGCHYIKSEVNMINIIY